LPPRHGPTAPAIIEFALQAGVLRFGEFITRPAARPLLFQRRPFNRGALLGKLARFYGQTLLAAESSGRIGFDMLFGPGVQGHQLAAATAVALAELGAMCRFAFNRKETKDHGEGGSLVGASLTGRVVILDDVITAGTSVRESVDLIKAGGATPAGVLIALDRKERAGPDDGLSERSAAQEVAHRYGMPVLAIADLDDLFVFLDSGSTLAGDAAPYREAMVAYRARYGA